MIEAIAIYLQIYLRVDALVPILVFDIETIPDIQGIRSLYTLDKNLSDDDVVNVAIYKRRQKLLETEVAIKTNSLNKVKKINQN